MKIGKNLLSALNSLARMKIRLIAFVSAIVLLALRRAIFEDFAISWWARIPQSLLHAPIQALSSLVTHTGSTCMTLISSFDLIQHFRVLVRSAVIERMSTWKHRDVTFILVKINSLMMVVHV